MKHALIALAVAGLFAMVTVHAETTPATTTPAAAVTTPAVDETNNAAVSSLCSSYADEDKVPASGKAAYIAKCMKGMTDLSEGIKETVPLVTENTEEPAAAPSSEKVNSDPEQLVKGEIVEIPDPTAEQLDAGKK